MSSIHEGYSASLFVLSLAASLGAFACSSTNNDSGSGGTTSATIGGASSGGSNTRPNTGGSNTSPGVGGTSASSPMTSSAETGGRATGGDASTGGTTTASSTHPTGGALATGGSEATSTSSVPESGGSSSTSSKATGGTGGMAMSGFGGTRNDTGIGGQGGGSSTKSTGGTASMGTHTGGRAASGGTGQVGGGATATGGMATLGGASAGGNSGISSGFALTSSELDNGGTIPTDATCESTAASSLLPPLEWVGAPDGTLSFAMVFVDVTLIRANPPSANGFHSAMWDIPASVSSLPKGLPAGSPPAGIAGLETVKQKKAPSGEAWLGPCPNFPSTTRTKTDTYEFRLYALNVATLPSNTSSMSVQQIYNYLEGLPPLGVAVLSGTSNAAATKLK